jgi:hypothetical protein
VTSTDSNNDSFEPKSTTVNGLPRTKPFPKGYPTLTPYIIVRNASEAIEFYKRAFGAVVELLEITQAGQMTITIKAKLSMPSLKLVTAY